MFKKLWKNYTIIVIILAYLVIALGKINWLGLQYDEVLFSNIAWGGIDKSIIVSKIGNFATMLMPYMGALKAYVYYLIFHIFGANVVSVRLPVIVLTGFSLFFIYKSIKYFFNKNTALLTTLLLVLNPSFVSFTLFDVGPSAFELFFKSVLFLLISLYLKDKKSKWIIILIGCLILGVYNKLNFIWIVNSVFVSFLIIDLNFIKRLYKYWVFFGLLFFAFILYFVKSQFWLAIGLDDFSLRLTIIFNNVAELIKGNLFFNYLGIWSGDYFNNIILVLWCLVVFVAFVIKIFYKNRDRKYLFLVFYTLMMLLQTAITTRAVNPWHMFMLEPFLTLLFVVSAISLLSKNALTKFVLIVFVIYGLWNNYQWFFGFKQNYTNIMWSKSIYDLCAYTKTSNNRFVSLDWGFHSQLLMFDPVEGKYEQIWGPLLTGYLSDDEKTLLINDKNIRYVTYSQIDSRWGIMSARDGWFNYVEKLGKNVFKEKEFYGADKSVISIYRIE
jgi:4-amino-4-deoxy-L-arabinose transferase-like glycosyltransferase